MNYMQSRQKAAESAQAKQIDDVVDRMLQLYCLLPHKPDPSKEEKKESPSKQAAQPVQSPAEQKNVSLKELMNAGQTRQQQLKDDLTIFPKEAVDKYKFFLQLFAAVRMTDQKIMSNDPNVVRQIYLSQKYKFSYPNDERTAQQMILDFFSEAEFLKRLQLHRNHICKSKTKKQQDIKLYYVEILQRERQINLIDFTSADKANGPDGLSVIQKDIDTRRIAQEQEQQKREEALAAKQEKAKLDKQVAKEKLEKLAKPKDKWKVGKKLLELQQQFPHDRVVQRMVKQEFQANQVFRYPEEYDKFN